MRIPLIGQPAAFGQVSPAQRLFLAQVSGGRPGNGKRRKRRATSAKSAPTRRKRASAAKRPARLVKGSAAAKRYMASIRRKRRR